MDLTFVCVLRSGGIYDDVWVARLFDQVSRHLNPDKLACLTDRPVPALFRYSFSAIMLEHGWPGWFSKLEIFRPGLFAGECLYADLDSLFLRPIPGLADKIAQTNRLCLLDDFFNPKRPASGVMAWVPSPQTERIYHEFVARPRTDPGWQNGDGAIIGQYPHTRIQSIFPGVFGSYKAHKLQRGPGSFAHVSFHGQPKNADFPPEHWVTKTWLGI